MMNKKNNFLAIKVYRRFYVHLGMVDRCQKHLLKTISADNCLKLRGYAERYRLGEVLVKVDEVLTDNFVDVLRQDGFKDLDVESVTNVIGKRKQMVSNKWKNLSFLFSVS